MVPISTAFFPILYLCAAMWQLSDTSGLSFCSFYQGSFIMVLISTLHATIEDKEIVRDNGSDESSRHFLFA